MTKYVDSYITQVLSRHAFDLWYLYDIHGVSRRAKQVLGYVRRWQRDAAWSSRVESLSKRWLVHGALHVWLDATQLMAPLADSSAEDTKPLALQYVYEDSSPDTSEAEVQVRAIFFGAVVTARSRKRRR